MNKINLPAGQLERFHNPKSPQDYIARIDTILHQKDEILEILQKFCLRSSLHPTRRNANEYAVFPMSASSQWTTGCPSGQTRLSA